MPLMRAKRVKDFAEIPAADLDSMSARILIVAGEASGDLQGALLARTLLKANPNLMLSGVGGPAMSAAGVELFYDSSQWGAVGATEIVPKYLPIWWSVQCLKARMRKSPPDLLVLIDAPSMNMSIAKFSHQQGIPTLYYFPPSAWSRNPQRARKVMRRVDEVVTVFAHTTENYRKVSDRVNYYGHPLLDLVREMPSPAEARKRLGLPASGRVVGIYPGSRTHEIKRLLPLFLKCAQNLKSNLPDLCFVLPVALPALKPLVMAGTENAGIPLTVVDGQSHLAMAASDLLLLCSGSSTLEAACFGTPMLLAYIMDRISWELALRLVQLRYAGLPNLLLNREVVPEFLQQRARVDLIVPAALELLDNQATREEMKQQLAQVRELLGSPPVVTRVAARILEMAGESRHD